MKRRPPEGSARRFAVKSLNLRGVTTNKVGRSVQFESMPEHALILHLDRDPTVRDYGTYAEAFTSSDHPTRLITVQCMVWRTNGCVEMHRILRAENRLTADDYKAVKLCEERGWRYVTHSADALTNGSTFTNLLALYRYRPSIYSRPDVTNAALALLSNGERRGTQDLVGDIADLQLLPLPTVVAAICHLLWHGVLAADLNNLLFVHSTLSRHATVWLPPQSEIAA